MSARQSPPRRADFRLFQPMPTRWMDNDAYGHVNNVTYYSYFDTAVTFFLIERDLLHPTAGETMFVVAETGCRYRREVAFPDTLSVGLRVGQIGTSSVTWELAIFREGEDEAAADGHFVHVHVSRDTRRPVPIPPGPRALLEAARLQENA